MADVKTFPLKLTPNQHTTIKRRAKASDRSMHSYCVELLMEGKLNKKPK